MEIVVGGCHGGWNEATDGYVKIPSGCTLYIFQEPGSLMSASVGAAVAHFSESDLQSLQGSQVMKLEADDIVPDYLTTTLEAELRPYFEGNTDPNVVQVGGDGMHLSEVLAQAKGNLYWFSCQAFMGTVSEDGYKDAVLNKNFKTV